MAFFKKSVSDWLGKQYEVMTVQAVSPETIARQSAIKNIAMYTAVGLIADIVCECERQFYHKGNLIRDGNWYVWNISANDNQSASELLTDWIFDIYTQRAGGLIIPLSNKLYHADSFSVEENPLVNNVYKSIAVGNAQIQRDYWERDVYHISLTDKNGRSVQNLVDAAFAEYAGLLSTASDSYSASESEKYVYQADERDWVGTPEQEAAERKALGENLKAFVNGKKAVYPLMRNQSLTKVSGGSSSGSSSAYSDIRKDVYAIVAEIMHLPASLLDGNMNNTSEVVNQALTFAVNPLCDRIAKELTRKTFTPQQIMDEGACVRFDTTRIRVRDVVDTADKLDKLISAGIMCIDEVRDQCSLPPIGEDWSQAHYITKNYEGITESHDMKGGD